MPIQNQYTIYPWIHSKSNIISKKDQIRPISLPDTSDSLWNPTGTKVLDPRIDFSMVAGDFLQVYSTKENKENWDCVVTCFFLDTAHDMKDYLNIIYKVLKKGGVWINLGPLLYHFQGKSPLDGKRWLLKS